jgi:hypothetical protein
MARLPRRRDDRGVVAVGEHYAPAARTGLALADRRVEVLGGRNLKALHSSGQRELVVGLDQQVDVCPLDAELDDAEVLASRCGERGLADRLVHAPPAQVADGADHPQDDVNRVPRVQERSFLVRRPRSLPLRRATSAAPLAATGLEHHQLSRLGAPFRAGGTWRLDLHSPYVDVEDCSVN